MLFVGRPDWHAASAYVARRHEYHVCKILELQARARTVATRMEHAYAALADRIDNEKRFMQAQRLRLDKELVRRHPPAAVCAVWPRGPQLARLLLRAHPRMHAPLPLHAWRSSLARVLFFCCARCPVGPPGPVSAVLFRRSRSRLCLHVGLVRAGYT